MFSQWTLSLGFALLSPTYEVPNAVDAWLLIELFKEVRRRLSTVTELRGSILEYIDVKSASASDYQALETLRGIDELSSNRN